MSNLYKNKVIYNGQTLIDLSADTVTADKMLEGITAHRGDGAPIAGTCSYDADTQDATAAVAEVLATKTYYGQGVKKTGTMPNRGGISETLETVAEEFTIPQGYHDGSGKVKINPTEQAKIIAGNIKQGINILGVTGTLEPSSSVTTQAKQATPTGSQQVILPDSGIDYLTQVTVLAIPYVEADNAAGGVTVTIG